jgi:hypothetical protein
MAVGADRDSRLLKVRHKVRRPSVEEEKVMKLSPFAFFKLGAGALAAALALGTGIERQAVSTVVAVQGAESAPRLDFNPARIMNPAMCYLP